MGQIIAFEVWLVLVTAPCVIAWIIGERHGAARMRKLSESAAIGSLADLTPLSPAPKSHAAQQAHSAVKRAAPMRAPSAADDSAVRSGRSVAPGGLQSELIEPSFLAAERAAAVAHRKETFDGMPSLSELHAQAERIRREGRVWDDPEVQLSLTQVDPISARVLDHYQTSIDELQRVTGWSGTLLNPADLMRERPRFADAAPVSTRTGFG
ncbi:MAG: hypothetical protein AAF494_05490 [Pseudomonadota bacterium]